MSPTSESTHRTSGVCRGHSDAANQAQGRAKEAAMYVVTGASGNTGSVVADKLISAGKKVRVVGRSAERLQRLTARGAEACICDAIDRLALEKAFIGAEGVYLMIPPAPEQRDYRAFQARVVDALASALKKAEVKHAVALSSFGADKSSGTGPVAGLHDFEQRLNQIEGLNVLCIRAGYFMENTLGQVGIIKAMGTAAGPVRGDLALPMIATQDIGERVAEALLARDFCGYETRELLGQRDVTMVEAATIIGRAVGLPNLSYLQLPASQVRPALIHMGMSENVADLILEMSEALNSGHMGALEKRSPRNTTPTSYEKFVQEEFVPQFNAKSSVA
jgi:uncharacterized protein YbjT (DUF2867 family)